MQIPLVHNIRQVAVARGEDRPDSDIDIMVAIDPEAQITVFDYVDLKEYIAGNPDRIDTELNQIVKPSLDPLRSPMPSPFAS